jgi:hypothetical protein
MARRGSVAPVNPEAPFDDDNDQYYESPQSSWWWFFIIVLVCVTVFGLVLAFTVGEGEIR